MQPKLYGFLFAIIAAVLLITAPLAIASDEFDEDDFDVEVEHFELEALRGSEVEAEIWVVDDGNTITVTGVATGLDFDAPFLLGFGIPSAYVSLFYDVESEEDGPFACEPGIFDPGEEGFLTDDQMFIGWWDVLPDGTGTLFAVGPIEYSPVDALETVSIRGAPLFGPLAVLACGES